MVFRYSEQANVLIEGMKDFSKEDFENWFNNSLSIGSNNILEYLIFKKRRQQAKMELEQKLKEVEGA
jgi:hypothetical protein